MGGIEVKERIMEYFKDKNKGEVYAYDQEQIDSGWVKEGLLPMTESEVEAHLNPKPTSEQLASNIRHERDKALKALDEVVSNPLRFSELLEEQRLEATSYRRFLLDVPQQKGFPIIHEMPKTPEWL